MPEDDLRPNAAGYLWIMLVIGMLGLASFVVSSFTRFSFTESFVVIVGGALVLGVRLAYDWLFTWTPAGDASSDLKKPAKDE